MQLTTEAGFSRSLSAKLKSAGFDVTRIESHGTANGIPDMFVMGHDIDFFLELKHVNKDKAGTITVPWRPGQQAWHNMYYLAHSKRKCSLTLMSCNDGVYFIPMSKVYEHDKVQDPWFIDWKDWVKFDKWSLSKLFHMLIDTRPCTYPDPMTRDIIMEFAQFYFPEVDYDPEVLVEDPDGPYEQEQWQQERLWAFMTLWRISLNC